VTTDRTLLDRVGVAARLNHSLEWFYKHYKALVSDGFPGPVLGSMGGARWDPAAIDDWLDHRRSPRTAAVLGGEPPAQANDLRAEAEELDRRSAILAGGGRLDRPKKGRKLRLRT